MAMKPQSNCIGKRNLKSNDVIYINRNLKMKMLQVKTHLEILSDPLSAQNKFEGVFAVYDDFGKVIPGVLKYSEVEGKSSAILGGIHMNELSGVYALMEFHRRWLNDVRPESGDIYIATGDIERSLEFIELVVNSEEVPKKVWGTFNSTKDHFNYNRIPDDIDCWINLDYHQTRAKQIVKHVIKKVNGRVLDLHNTSTDAPPMVTLFMKRNETPEECLGRLKCSGVTRGLPIEDYITWKPGPFNGMNSIRMLGNSDDDTFPILIENGASYDHRSFLKASYNTEIWLRNIYNLEPGKKILQYSEQRNLVKSNYVERGDLFHPAVKPLAYDYLDHQTLKQAQKDTFILIRDKETLLGIKGWSKTSRQIIEAFDESELSKNRLDNFRPIKKDDLIAMGLETGIKINAPEDGYIFMVGTNPFIKPTVNESFANYGIRIQGLYL